MDLASTPRVFPLSPDGASAGTVLPQGAVTLADFTAHPRFGIKGPGSAAWLQAVLGPLPEVNRTAVHGDARLVRLGGEDFLLTGAGSVALAEAWRAAAPPRGYWSWREEGWAWLQLGGPDAAAVMARLCAIDLRDERFPAGALAQTRVAHLEAIVVPTDGRFDLFFDVASTGFMVRSIAAAADRAAQGRVSAPDMGS